MTQIILEWVKKEKADEILKRRIKYNSYSDMEKSIMKNGSEELKTIILNTPPHFWWDGREAQPMYTFGDERYVALVGRKKEDKDVVCD